MFCEIDRGARSCERLGADRRGTMIPLIGFALAIGISAAALGIDYTRARALQQSLELAADAAALAAATRLPDMDSARTVALAYVEKNMPSAKYGDVLDPNDVEFGSWDEKTRDFIPSTDGSTHTAVRVSTRLAQVNGNPVSTFFAAAFGFNTLDVSASATAGRGGPPCVMVLEPTKMLATNLVWDAHLEAFDCGVQVNSTAKAAISAGDKAYLSASDICVGGTVWKVGSPTISPDPREYCPGQADPLAGLELPAIGSCDYTNEVIVNSTMTLSPGVYCGGLNILNNSDITLAAGTYVMKDGDLKVVGTSTLRGEEVTIVFTGTGSNLEFMEGSTVDLGAPKSGDLQGILIFQDPAHDAMHRWLGDAKATMRGVIYIPTGGLWAQSDNNITPYRSCTVLIAKTISLGWSSTMSIDLSNAGCRATLPSPYGRNVILLD